MAEQTTGGDQGTTGLTEDSGRQDSGRQDSGRQRTEAGRETAVSPRGTGSSRGLQQQPRRGERGALSRGYYTPPLASLSPFSLLTLSPFTLMRRLSEEMDQMFSGFGSFGDLGGTRAGGQQQALSRQTPSFFPQIETFERDNQLVVRVDLPGLTDDEVTITVADDALIIEGERRSEDESRQGGIFRSERSYGMFHREIPLPPEAQEDRANAQFQSGVLEIVIPLDTSRRQGRRIPIGGSGRGATTASSVPPTSASAGTSTSAATAGGQTPGESGGGKRR